ncbi:MAG TPA: histidine phosphatase family protein [Thermohalobaculum sp.]|nr:histidine phosphatase family protein [Thermohalobaculum sp.]
MRHAEASWTEGGANDLDRPLNRDGEAAAAEMAPWLAGRGLRPGRILCSPARRTRQTAELMRGAVPGLPQPDIVPELYLAGPQAILNVLRQLPDNVEVALLIGHEPGLSSAAQALGGPSAPAQFAPASVAVFTLEAARWGDLVRGRVRGVEFKMPGDR